MPALLYPIPLQTGPSAAPTGFAVVSVSSSSVTLTWDTLMCIDENGPLMGYIIEYTPDGGMPSTTSLTGSNQLTGLAACTNYTLRIAAQNDAGIGDFSAPLSVITNVTGKQQFHGRDQMCNEFVLCADVPGPVFFNPATTNLMSVTISWTAPYEGSGAIVEYQIWIVYDGTSTVVNTVKEMYFLPDLSPDTRARFSVSAVSVCGAVGVLSTTTEDTDSIRKSRCIPSCKNTPIHKSNQFLLIYM